MGTEAWEEARVANGVAAPGRELTDLYNPLEAGLLHAVSLAKGCYVGQETLAKVYNTNGEHSMQLSAKQQRVSQCSDHVLLMQCVCAHAASAMRVCTAECVVKQYGAQFLSLTPIASCQCRREAAALGLAATCWLHM